MANNKYTERQLQVIRGEVPIESADGRFLRWFLQKAIHNNDDVLSTKIKQQLDKLKAEAYERTKQRSRTRTAKLKHHEEISWKQPKSNEYTEHQKRIVRGEIPYEDVHTKELIHIHLKAHNNGDYELSERLLDLITTRRMQAIEKDKEYDRQYSKKYNDTIKKSKEFDTLTGINSDLPLTQFDKAALMNYNPLDEASKIRLNQAIDILKKRGDEESAAMITSFLLCKKDRGAFYVVKEHGKAIDLIEELLQLPIRRPQTWFSQDSAKEDE